MSTSPLDPQDIRAAAEVHRELGPEYSDAVVAAFIDRIDRAVEARVEARLAAERQRQPAERQRQPAERQRQPLVRGTRRALLKGVAIGVCASALVAGVSISHAHVAIDRQAQAKVIPRGGLPPGQGQLQPRQGPLPAKGGIKLARPPQPKAAAPAPAAPS